MTSGVRFRSIRTKVLLVRLITIAIEIAAFLFVAVAAQRQLRQQLRAAAMSTAQQTAFVTAPLIAFDSRNELNKALELLRTSPDFAYAQVSDESGLPLASLGHVVPARCRPGRNMEILARGNYLDIHTPIVDGGKIWGCLQMGISQQRTEQNAAYMWLIAIGAAGLTLLVALINDIYLSRSIAYPVMRLAEAASRVGRGDWDTPIDVHTHDEIGALAGSFRSMLEKLRRTTVSKTYLDDILHSMADSLIVVDSERKIRTAQNSSIMVVDDQPANLKLLEDMLRQQDYFVRSFPRGRMALAAAVQHPPDLILLDINMPEMNGYEVCERLKSDERLSRIPVIFLSALDETEDKVKAFRCGGMDYVTKPFQLEEVQARVQIHLKVVHLQRQLQLHNDLLEELVRSRTRELTEANARLRILDQSKSDFLRLIAHEFRTPLNGLLGIGELLLDDMASTPQANDFRDVYESSRRRILTILEDASLLTEIKVGPEKFAPTPVALTSIVNRAIERTAAFSLSRQVAIGPVPSADGLILGVDELMTRAIQALLETAVQFSTPRETVRLEHHFAPDAVRLLIESRGYTIPDALLPKFFDLLAIGEAIIPGGDAGGDLGLAPPVAARILALFGGSVSVENHDSAGIRLTVSLKRAENLTHA